MGNALLDAVSKKGKDTLLCDYTTINDIPVSTIEGNPFENLRTLLG